LRLAAEKTVSVVVSAFWASAKESDATSIKPASAVVRTEREFLSAAGIGELSPDVIDIAQRIYRQSEFATIFLDRPSGPWATTSALWL
jgi:hypothetical protein